MWVWMENCWLSPKAMLLLTNLSLNLRMSFQTLTLPSKKYISSHPRRVPNNLSNNLRVPFGALTFPSISLYRLKHNLCSKHYIISHPRHVLNNLSISLTLAARLSIRRAFKIVLAMCRAILTRTM